jgi:hypothetical protein
VLSLPSGTPPKNKEFFNSLRKPQKISFFFNFYKLLHSQQEITKTIQEVVAAARVALLLIFTVIILEKNARARSSSSSFGLNKDFMLMAYSSFLLLSTAPRRSGADIAGPILLAFKVETARCNG